MKKLSLILCALIAFAIIAACGPSDPNTNGSGGSAGSSTTTTTGTGGSGGIASNGGGGTGSGGGLNVCHPSEADPFITADPTCDVCECNVTNTTDPAFCTQWRDQGIELCPAGGNACEPGINRCGYNLPVGQAYELPDAQCKLFVMGDTWTDENFNAGVIGSSPSQYNENGQLEMSGLIGLSSSYYSNFIMSGRKLYWNRYNEQSTDSAICTFSADCMTLDCIDSPTGTGHTFWWQNHP